METNVTIVGASIASCMCAAYMKIKNPKWNVTMIGKTDQSHPIVGESLTEYSTYFLHEIGLGRYLEENHYHKYGLTFYFKQDINDPSCRRYAVHEANAIPPMPANLINRFDFDKVIHKRCLEVGVNFIEGKALDLKITSDKKYDVSYKCDAINSSGHVISDFLVDGSGRSRWLSRRLGLKKLDPIHQRSVFWFWVADFDRSKLFNIDAVKERQFSFNPYFVTHHFMGRGNWSWIIPIASNEYKEMVSVGITWRPDLLEKPINNMEEYLDYMGNQHPVVREYVESGKIVKTNYYSNYMYESEKLYSEDGWFLLGDAGDTVDPLYSTGLVMNSIQSTQINELINAKLQNRLTASYARDLEDAHKIGKAALQAEIGDLYSVMHDPYQTQWRIHFSSAFYFFSLLPMWLCKFMISRRTSVWIKSFIAKRRESYLDLLSQLPLASANLGKIDVKTIPNLYNISVNWKLWGPNSSNLEKDISKLYLLFAKFRWMILKDSGFKNTFKQLAYISKDILSAFYFRFFFSFKNIINYKDSGKQFELIDSQLNLADVEEITPQRAVGNM